VWLLFDRLINLLALIAGILLCGLVVLICADVGSRHFGLFSMPWSLDAAEHSLLFITFLGAPWVLREQGHIAVDILVQHMGKRTRAVTDRIAYALGSVTCAILFYYACMVWWRSFEANTEIQRTYVYPEWLILSCAPPVFLILLIIFLRWLFVGPTHKPAETDGLSDGL
jgi:C4-dicarboxylate transporter DctQ subunit